ncbi:hypothetical protein EIP91_005612 [Steccherinum ochraceum]|uniref:Uncharacterized protein n=1 Tax=Steccherinum ochraceum TaxID=92696 RepID=A0A4R0R715_9APHY|nr:hypothetical protein EIP91_005612 [Steccherinum ochraceum]
MDALFRQCFACCIRDRSRISGEPDERSRLIEPPRDAVLPPGPSYIVDHQKMRERIGAIVDSKKRMMVNVNAQLPFNLQNKTLHLKFDPSTSRSAQSLSISPSTAHPDLVSYFLNSRLSDTSSGAGGSRLPSYSPTRSRDLSPSLQTSRSASSLHPGDASLPGVYSENGSRQPIFNARLIPPNGGFRVGGNRGRSTTRGRLGRHGEERGRSTPELQQRLDEDGTRDEDTNVGGIATGNASAFVDSEMTRTPTMHSPSTIRQVDEFSSDGGTPLATEFRIQDVGKISRSWGD